MTVTRRIGGARARPTTELPECAHGEHESCPGERDAAGVTYVCVCGCHRDPWPFPCAEAPELELIVEIPSL